MPVDRRTHFLDAFVMFGSHTKGRTIRKLMGGGGEVQKRYSRKAKLNEKKIHARHITLKNIHATA